MGLSFCLWLPPGVLIGPLGVILGIIALVLIRRDRTRYGGKRAAIVGICTGVVGTALMAAAWVGDYYSGVRLRAFYRFNRICRAMDGYQADHSVYPPDLQTLVTAKYLTPDALRDPYCDKRNSVCDYHYVVGLQPSDPPDWIIIYSDPAQRRDKKGCVLFMGGQFEYYKEPQFSQVLQRFRAEYQAAYGKPPVIIKPR